MYGAIECLGQAFYKDIIYTVQDYSIMNSAEKLMDIHIFILPQSLQW